MGAVLASTLRSLGVLGDFRGWQRRRGNLERAALDQAVLPRSPSAQSAELPDLTPSYTATVLSAALCELAVVQPCDPEISASRDA